MAELDPEYLRLYREYARAITALNIAVEKRKRIINQLAVKRSPVLQVLSQWNRRPVGAPPKQTSRVRGPGPAPRKTRRRAEGRIYMGRILGWARIIGWWVPMTEAGPETGFGYNMDIHRMCDQISLKQYQNVKGDYRRAKRVFFDYVRRQNIKHHEAQAKAALDHGANLQLLGVNEGEAQFEEARKEVQGACENAERLYQSSSSKKSVAMKILLLDVLANAQLVDLESATTQKITGILDGMGVFENPE